jgi:hypothetical protein
VHVRVKICPGIILARNVQLFGDKKIKGEEEPVFFLFGIKGVIDFGFKVVPVMPFKNTAHGIRFFPWEIHSAAAARRAAFPGGGEYPRKLSGMLYGIIIIKIYSIFINFPIALSGNRSFGTTFPEKTTMPNVELYKFKNLTTNQTDKHGLLASKFMLLSVFVCVVGGKIKNPEFGLIDLFKNLPARDLCRPEAGHSRLLFLTGKYYKAIIILKKFNH